VDDEIKRRVQERYAAVARRVAEGSGCCGGPIHCTPITRDLYTVEEVAGIPREALQASLGCGNPTALAELRPGDVVLDLGSGGGLDALLAARRVGPAGRVYGLDMTDEMLELARDHARRAGVSNVAFLRGEMEAIPLPDATVDVIISNCVVNLSPDKDRVLAEAFRVLRPGGRLALADIVVRRPVGPTVRRSVEAWIGCLAGALEEHDYRARLARAGFVEIALEPLRLYGVEDVREALAATGLDADRLASTLDGAFMSALVRGRKPAEAAPPPGGATPGP
jgi:SAM-dependent methyltransferase